MQLVLLAATLILACAIYVFFLNLREYDEWGRYAMTVYKQSVECPKQTRDTAVIFIFGQSNSANYADHKVKSKYPNQVVNFFQGKCYSASSPLLGASGRLGEYLTLLGDDLIESEAFKNIVLISSGIGNTSISSWNEGGTSNLVLMKSLDELKGEYKVDFVIWHQGERDFLDNNSSEFYINQFKSLQGKLIRNEIKAPILIAISTKCGIPFLWKEKNSISDAQKSLINNINIIEGANTDININSDGRSLINPCHLNKKGQIITANFFSKAISSYQKSLAIQ